MRLGGLLAATVAAIGLVACGTQTIDRDDLERQLQEQLSADAGIDQDEVSVTCPEDIEVEEGREFECSLTVPDSGSATVDVTLTDDEGGFEAVMPLQRFDERLDED